MLNFICRLARSIPASPGRTVDLFMHHEQPRPLHLSVPLPPPHPFCCQCCLRGIPSKAITPTQIRLPLLPPSQSWHRWRETFPTRKKEVMGHSMQNGASQKLREGKEASPPGQWGCWSVPVGQPSPLHMPPVWGVVLEAPWWRPTSINS